MAATAEVEEGEEAASCDPAALMLLERGTTLAGYRIERVLGQGGMGVVYEATQLSLSRTVALKLLAPNLRHDESFRERFRREGELQARMEHPHILTVFEAGEDPYGLFLAMQLVRGPNLKELIMRRELTTRRTLQILAPVASALTSAHQAGLIHRDIKPQNILIGVGDHPYLADFGLTTGVEQRTLTRSGQVVGTDDYIAPEQIQGGRATVQSDIYALTAVLYECLTGTVPFPRETAAAILYAHLTEEPPRVSERLSELSALDAVISKGMAKDPAARHASAVELLQEGMTASAAEAADIAVPIMPPPPRTGRRDETGDTVSDIRQTPTRGDRIGPTRADSAQRYTPVPTSGRRRRWVTAGVLVAAIGTGIAGFLLGHDGSETARSQEFNNTRAVGPLEIGFPADWQTTSQSPSIPGVVFANRIDLRSERSGGERLTAGQVDAAGPTLLPRPLVRRLPDGKAPQPRGVVAMDGMRAYLYQGLRPRGTRRPLDMIVAPTTRGVATVACHSAESTRSTAECRRIATSLKLLDGRPFPLGADEDYATRLNRVTGKLDARVSSGKTTVDRARTSAQQASAAAAIARAYGSAGNALRDQRVSPAVQPLHAAIVAAMRRTSLAYRALASAAARGSAARYRTARAQVRRSEEALSRAMGRLRRSGYRLE